MTGNNSNKFKISRRSFVKALGATAALGTAGGLSGCTGGEQAPVSVAPATKNNNLHPAVCPYCGVGCGTYYVTDNGKIVGSIPDAKYPVNKGTQCVKGLNAYQAVNAKRISKPMIRDNPALKGTLDGFREVSWDEALTYVANKFNEIKAKYGPSALAAYQSGQLMMEAQYIFNKLWKVGIGSNIIEANARMCMTSAVMGMFRSMGSDAPPTCYEDLELCDLWVDIGHNPRGSHPVVYWKVADQKKLRGLKTVVIDPRKTGTAKGLEEIDPNPENTVTVVMKSNADITLLNSLGYVLIHELSAVDQEWVSANADGAEKFIEGVKKYKPEDVADITGVDPATVRQIAKMWVEAKNGVITMWTMGVNQRPMGVQIVQTIVNLHAITGKMGKPGSGPFSMTGQPNAMGERYVGGLTDKLPGNRSLKSPKDREAVAKIWGDLEAVSHIKNPEFAVGMMRRGISGYQGPDAVKAYFLCYSTHIDLPDQNNIVRPALRNAFVVSSEIYPEAANCYFSDVILPAATHGECWGTYINSDRRIYVNAAAVQPPEGTLPDMDIMIDLAKKMGVGERFDYPKKDGYYDAEAVFKEIVEVMKGSDSDISGIEGYDHMLQLKGIRWPAPTKEVADKGGYARRYNNQEEGWADKPYPNYRTESGKVTIRFSDQVVYTSPDGGKWGAEVIEEDLTTPRPEMPDFEYQNKAPNELPPEKYPFWLSTGVVYEHFHTAKTIRSSHLLKLIPEQYIEMHEEDAKLYGLEDGDWVVVTTRRGEVTCRASVGPNSKIGPRGRNSVQRGMLFMPWNLSVADTANPSKNKWLTNALTSGIIDKISGQANFKHSAARVRKV